MATPDCNAACIKAILDGNLEAEHAMRRAHGAALLDLVSNGGMSTSRVTPADVSAFTDACKAMCAASDKLAAAAGYPRLAKS